MGRIKNFNREDVLDSAIQLFWKKGYADTSLSDLEKATGVNKSGLYSEFKDKDDIFLESLKRYRDISPAYDILNTSPLGWKNIEMFLKLSMTCKGQKGCLLANTLREHSIVPSKVRNLLEINSLAIHELIIKNVKATATKKDPELLAAMINTYAVGMFLKLNVMKPDELSDEMMGFLDLCKK